MIAMISNIAEYAYTANPVFGGMSGVVYGLFGYVWMKVQFDPRSGFVLDPVTVVVMIGWLFLCMTGYLGNIANAAHVAGLLAGMAFGYLPIVLRRPK
jgi:GlpG protein